MIREREFPALPGLPILIGLILVVCGSVYGIVAAAGSDNPWLVVVSALSLLLAVFLLVGHFVVNPNEGRVLQFFGDYVGTARPPGCDGRTRSTREAHFAAGAQFRKRAAESLKSTTTREPHRNRGGGGVARGRHREAMFQVDDYNNYVKGKPICAAQSGHQFTYDRMTRRRCPLGGHTAASRSISRRKSRSVSREPEWKRSNAHQPPAYARKSPRRCCSAAGRRDHCRAAADSRRRGGMVEMALDMLSRRAI